MTFVSAVGGNLGDTVSVWSDRLIPEGNVILVKLVCFPNSPHLFNSETCCLKKKTDIQWCEVTSRVMC